MQKQEKCAVVEKVRMVPCSSTMLRGMDFGSTHNSGCQEMVEEEICREVSTTVTKKGVRYETKQERYPCTSTTAKEVCVELQQLGTETCSAQVSETREASCTRRKKKQVCVDKVFTNMEICAEIAEETVEYPCQKIEYEEVSLKTHETLGCCLPVCVSAATASASSVSFSSLSLSVTEVLNGAVLRVGRM